MSVPYFSLISSKIGPTTSGMGITPETVNFENAIDFAVSGAFFFLSGGLGQTSSSMADIRTLGVLDVPFVGDRVAPVDELESVPLENEADRAIEAVDRRNAADDHAVLVVDHLVYAIEGELVELELSPSKVDYAGAGGDIPDVHLLHQVERVFGAVFGRAAARTPDAERRESVHDRTAEPECRQVSHVIDVQVPDEHFVEIVVGDLLGREPLVAAATEVGLEVPRCRLASSSPVSPGITTRKVGNTNA
jgi:hypothetical protein